MTGTFCTAINCMDGRVQKPVLDFLKKTFQADYVDEITEPGPARILAEQKDRAILKSILNRVTLSVERHGSRRIAIVGHYDCAGNPVNKPQQMAHLAKSVAFVRKHYPGVEVIGIWVDRNWRAKKVLLPREGRRVSGVTRTTQRSPA